MSSSEDEDEYSITDHSPDTLRLLNETITMGETLKGELYACYNDFKQGKLKLSLQSKLITNYEAKRIEKSIIFKKEEKAKMIERIWVKVSKVVPEELPHVQCTISTIKQKNTFKALRKDQIKKVEVLEDDEMMRNTDSNFKKGCYTKLLYEKQFLLKEINSNIFEPWRNPDPIYKPMILNEIDSDMSKMQEENPKEVSIDIGKEDMHKNQFPSSENHQNQDFSSGSSSSDFENLLLEGIQQITSRIRNTEEEPIQREQIPHQASAIKMDIGAVVKIEFEIKISHDSMTESIDKTINEKKLQVINSLVLENSKSLKTIEVPFDLEVGYCTHSKPPMMEYKYKKKRGFCCFSIASDSLEVRATIDQMCIPSYKKGVNMMISYNIRILKFFKFCDIEIVESNKIGGQSKAIDLLIFEQSIKIGKGPYDDNLPNKTEDLVHHLRLDSINRKKHISFRIECYETSHLIRLYLSEVEGMKQVYMGFIRIILLQQKSMFEKQEEVDILSRFVESGFKHQLGKVVIPELLS